jgi:hypothetical protein
MDFEKPDTYFVASGAIQRPDNEPDDRIRPPLAAAFSIRDRSALHRNG